MKYQRFLLLFSLLVAACSSPVPEKYRLTKRDKYGNLRPYTPRYQYEVLEDIPMEGVGTETRTPETVKAYAVRRYVDPVDKRVMHERGVIYRVEQDARWNLAGNPKSQALIGPTVGVSNPRYRPSPVSSELAKELQKAQSMNAAMAQAMRQQTAQGSSTGELVRATQGIADGQSKIAGQLDQIASGMLDLDRRLKPLEAQAHARELSRPDTLPQPAISASPASTPPSKGGNAVPMDEFEAPKQGILDTLKR